MVKAVKSNVAKQSITVPQTTSRLEEISSPKKTTAPAKKQLSPINLDGTPKLKNVTKLRKASNAKTSKSPKSQSFIKKADAEHSKIPIPISKSSTYKQVAAQKPKLKPRKSLIKKKNPMKIERKGKPVDEENTSIPPADRFVISQQQARDLQQLERLNNREIELRIKRMQKRDSDSLKKMKDQYFNSAMVEIHKQEMEKKFHRMSSELIRNDSIAKDLQKRQIIKIIKPPDSSPKKTIKVGSKIVNTAKKIIKKATNKAAAPKKITASLNPTTNSSPRFDAKEINLMKLAAGSTDTLTTHFRASVESAIKEADAAAPKKVKKLVKKLHRVKVDTGPKDAKTTQITHHKKKSKLNTSKLARVHSSDSVPLSPVREIKHNDSFVISARKLEHTTTRRPNALKSPEQLKLKAKRTGSTQRPIIKSEILQTDATKPDQLKSCLKKHWVEKSKIKDFSDLDEPFDFKYGRVPLVVN